MIGLSVVIAQVLFLLAPSVQIESSSLSKIGGGKMEGHTQVARESRRCLLARSRADRLACHSKWTALSQGKLHKL